MFNQTEKQKQAEKELNQQGFRFSNWISAQTEDENEGCMVMVRKPTHYRTEYREIAPDGSIN